MVSDNFKQKGNTRQPPTALTTDYIVILTGMSQEVE